jgi:hypothetical protein
MGGSLGGAVAQLLAAEGGFAAGGRARRRCHSLHRADDMVEAILDPVADVVAEMEKRGNPVDAVSCRAWRTR